MQRGKNGRFKSELNFVSLRAIPLLSRAYNCYSYMLFSVNYVVSR